MIYQAIRRFIYRRIGKCLSSITNYCDAVFYWSNSPDQFDLLYNNLPASAKTRVHSIDELERSIKSADPSASSHTVLNGIFNSNEDIQRLLLQLKTVTPRQHRISLVLFNPYLRWVYQAADSLGLRKGSPTTTFVTETDIHNLAKISGFEVVRTSRLATWFLPLGGLGEGLDSLLNLIPGVRNLALVWVVILRPVMVSSPRPSLTVLIPARNERGNIQAALDRMPTFGGMKPEIIFVEGHSNDQTWEEIQRVQALYGKEFSIKSYQQTGKGKNDAVRLGFSKASGDLLVILDADLTMPPELLTRFYDAYCEGRGDFINGSRLTYTMEGEAMRFLNKLGNVFFAKALSFVLGVRLGDTLCGTKLVSRRDYLRMIAWRRDFGDFDPFGDFELLFPAATLGLGVVDIPIKYRARTYGSTNISRFTHGLMLMKMTLIGLFRVKLS